ncbi:hypothetical protein PFICI_02490 [Pestalotiopsis fici W106-1]|uniref:Uncharacterized protein n=1 Tax=Pestalotiopsis fici (strain W106-1 / CGMCC3.15140) TaxID=1229662 RepID=W3XEI8_PESFW|nr:uncharacterized protein PFICI_02490 [Pestalotiopsis fici W106-1]ETS84465.1 hypothetical protein PFICI_02490 [Pestalotiopsis fici W106-1]
MPTTRANAASEAAKHEEFSARKPASEPLTRKGHAVGTKVGNDAIPEYHAEVFPAGTAPQEFSHHANTEGEVPGQAFNEFDTTRTSASDTLTGADSQTLNKGLGKPVKGQEENKMKGGHSRSSGRKSGGLAGVGAPAGIDSARLQGADLGKHHKGLGEHPSATEEFPQSAEQLASERH